MSMIRIQLLLSIMGATLAHAQPVLPPVTCYERTIEIPYETWNGVVPQCLDTIRIGKTSPMPPTGLMPPGSCAELFEVTGKGASRIVRKVPAKVLCENAERVMVIPEEILTAENDPGKIKTYEVHMYCEYWRGKKTTDTNSFSFMVSRGFRAHAAAIDYDTGLEITEPGLVEPTADQAVNTGQAPFRLNAWSNQKYEFLFWTCTYTRVPYDIYAPFQEIRTLCWPINVTTVFNAMFRQRTSDVEELPSSSVRVSRSGETISIERTLPADGEIMILTATGRVVHRSLWSSAIERIALEDLATGMYLCVVRDGHHVTQTPIHHY